MSVARAMPCSTTGRKPREGKRIASPRRRRHRHETPTWRGSRRRDTPDSMPEPRATLPRSVRGRVPGALQRVHVEERREEAHLRLAIGARLVDEVVLLPRIRVEVIDLADPEALIADEL